MRNSIESTHRPQGFIAILSLLIVATVTMFFAIAMLMDGVSNAALSLNSIYTEDARINVHTCIEDVLYRLRLEQQFNQNLNYTISEGNTCSTTMTWFAPSQVAPGTVERLVNVDVVGTSHNFTRHFRYDLRVTRYTVNNPDGTYGYTNTVDYIAVSELAS
ncbi:hypothetical protein HZA44_00855 [Candidatus Peregrinibacteria bacterium]|nr:hypothetical protein [Candidatus Peregrinibacteria bacterium]